MGGALWDPHSVGEAPGESGFNPRAAVPVLEPKTKDSVRGDRSPMSGSVGDAHTRCLSTAAHSAQERSSHFHLQAGRRLAEGLSSVQSWPRFGLPNCFLATIILGHTRQFPHL